MRGKRAVTGEIISMIVATIVVLILLALFALGNAAFKAYIGSNQEYPKEFVSSSINSFTNLVLLRQLVGYDPSRFVTIVNDLNGKQAVLASDAEKINENTEEARAYISEARSKFLRISVQRYGKSLEAFCCEIGQGCISSAKCNFLQGYSVLQFKVLPFSIQLNIQNSLLIG